MKRLFSIYHPEIPEFLQAFADTPPMQRLKAVGMNCGCEYTNFPRFAEIGPYSRYEHSLGVALIVWHFTQDPAQAVAGLFHDVTTPVFAHVVDFLNGDHLHQESTEAGVAACLEGSREIMTLLEKYNLTVEQVCDYHRYPIADNDSPALSADRLEYTMGNLLNYGFADLETIAGFYRDLIVDEDEADRPELVFRTAETAAAFTLAALKNSHVYVADEDRFAMQALAELLRLALEKEVLRLEDLHTTEPPVIRALEGDAVCCEAWRKFCAYSRILRREERPVETGWLQIPAKKRWIDPMAQGMGRVSAWHMEAAEGIRQFRRLDFSCWVRGE